MSLPAADDLFRPTVSERRAEEEAADAAAKPVHAVPDRPQRRRPASRGAGDAGEAGEAGESGQGSERKPSGRVRHDEKMTVYVTSDELLDLEHARLSLRRTHGLAVDRGRLVREAVAMVLADYEAHGEDSALVRRLTPE
ncbi:hypothetical protein BJZ21_002069 [Nocardioides panaciterrulae]|uniref:Cobyrinic acid a,c-diamide synthase n=1 Tax=Nocardioides panaciterrulae TaxID=661492 RepID=A0A7Y9E6X0_9ACTN|nr:hypothetical protein [Nocardioides panaciterrulae]